MLSQDLQLVPWALIPDWKFSFFTSFFSRRSWEIVDFDSIHNLSQSDAYLLLNAIVSWNSFDEYKGWLISNQNRELKIPLQVRMVGIWWYLKLLNDQDEKLKETLAIALRCWVIWKDDQRIKTIFSDNTQLVEAFISKYSKSD